MPHGLPPSVGSVLDVGCGIRPQNMVPAIHHVCVDAYRPYIEQAQREHPNLVFIHGRWEEVLPRLMDHSFDLVFAADFIEHLTKLAGTRFLAEAQRIGHHVAIFTPQGPYEQSYRRGERDAWGMRGTRWQTHRSAWTPEDFSDWDTEIIGRFHGDADAFWAVKDTSTKEVPVA